MQLSDFIPDYLSDSDEGVKALITFFLNLVMRSVAKQQARAVMYERTGTRTARRNGSKPRGLLLKIGKLTVDKPEFREKSFEHRFQTIKWNGSAYGVPFHFTLEIFHN